MTGQALQHKKTEGIKEMKKHKNVDVAELLDEIGLEYEEDHGSYDAVIELEDDRTQLVSIGCEPYELDETSVIQLWSKAADVDDLDDDDFARLLMENGESAVGGWEICGDRVIFTAKVPSSVTADELEEIIGYVAIIADETEKEFSDEDEN